MTAQQAFETRFEDKLNTLMPYLVKTTRRGNEDLIQEGAIGIWKSMKAFPDAAPKFHATKAKWSIISVARGVGRSVDIPPSSIHASIPSPSSTMMSFRMTPTQTLRKPF